MKGQMREKAAQNYLSPPELDGIRWLTRVLMRGRMQSAELVLKEFLGEATLKKV